MVGVLSRRTTGRRRLRVNGVPVGELIGPDVVPLPGSAAGEGAGSIIVLIATDAPLLPGQCDRVARRAAFGIARTGGWASARAATSLSASRPATPTSVRQSRSCRCGC